MKAALQIRVYTGEPVLYMAMELADKTWKLQFSDGSRKRSKSVEALNRFEVLEAIGTAKAKLKLSADCRVISCYEAGREGFSLARWLESVGVENLVVDASAIEVNRKAKRAKTDRVDVEQLMRQLQRYVGGEMGALSVVRVPTDEAEDWRHLHREREALVVERGRHRVRIQCLLRTQGLRVEAKAGFLEQLSGLRRWDGSPVPPELMAQLEREWARHELVNAQIKELEREQRERVRQAGGDGALAMVSRLMRLKAVGWHSAWVLVMEFFAWRGFSNRRELAALAGLTPTPYHSGQSEREQGISKAGNRRIRRLMVELAWMWLRHQPDSALSCWFGQRFGGGGKRLRRIGIVAMARKLLIALWRYLMHGERPEGAVLSA